MPLFGTICSLFSTGQLSSVYSPSSLDTYSEQNSGKIIVNRGGGGSGGGGKGGGQSSGGRSSGAGSRGSGSAGLSSRSTARSTAPSTGSVNMKAGTVNMGSVGRATASKKGKGGSNVKSTKRSSYRQPVTAAMPKAVSVPAPASYSTTPRAYSYAATPTYAATPRAYSYAPAPRYSYAAPATTGSWLSSAANTMRSWSQPAVQAVTSAVRSFSPFSSFSSPMTSMLGGINSFGSTLGSALGGFGFGWGGGTSTTQQSRSPFGSLGNVFGGGGWW